MKISDMMLMIKCDKHYKPVGELSLGDVIRNINEYPVFCALNKSAGNIIFQQVMTKVDESYSVVFEGTYVACKTFGSKATPYSMNILFKYPDDRKAVSKLVYKCLGEFVRAGLVTQRIPNQESVTFCAEGEEYTIYMTDIFDFEEEYIVCEPEPNCCSVLSPECQLASLLDDFLTESAEDAVTDMLIAYDALNSGYTFDQSKLQKAFNSYIDEFDPGTYLTASFIKDMYECFFKKQTDVPLEDRPEEFRKCFSKVTGLVEKLYFTSNRHPSHGRDFSVFKELSEEELLLLDTVIESHKGESIVLGGPLMYKVSGLVKKAENRVDILTAPGTNVPNCEHVHFVNTNFWNTYFSTSMFSDEVYTLKRARLLIHDIACPTVDNIPYLCRGLITYVKEHDDLSNLIKECEFLGVKTETLYTWLNLALLQVPAEEWLD